LLYYPPGTGKVENHGVYKSCTEALREWSCEDKMWGDFLKQKCPRSCKVAGCPPLTTTTVTTTTTTTVVTTTTEDGCKDNPDYRDFTNTHQPCSDWAGFDCTEYDEDSIELVKNCPVSCEMCGAEIPSCRRRSCQYCTISDGDADFQCPLCVRCHS